MADERDLFSELPLRLLYRHRRANPAIGGEPGTQPGPSLTNIRGASQAVTTWRNAMPSPKSNVIATGFPSKRSRGFRPCQGVKG